MSFLQNMAIRQKLTAIIMLICIAALLLAGTAFIAWEYITLRNQMVQNLSIHAEMTADNCKAAVAFNNAEDAEETLNALKAEPSVVFGCIRTKNSKVFALYRRDGMDKTSCPGEQITNLPEVQKENHFFSDGHLTVFRPIILDGETIGTLWLRSDLQPMYTMLKRNVSVIIIVLCFVLLIAYFVSLRIQRIISEPILSLAETATKIGKGQLYHRVKIESKDELGLLAASFNDMAGKLKDSYTSLEEKVRQRTAELTSANTKLEAEITERSRAQKGLQRHIKQLNCLYDLSKLIERPKISLEQIFQETTELIRNTYRHPELTCVRITFEGIQHKTANFRKTEQSQHATIRVMGEKAGEIEVYYLSEKAENGQEPFIKEERDLLDAIAEHLGGIAGRKKTADKLQLFRDLINRSNDCIFIKEPKWGRFLDVNQKACDSLGYTREELLGMSVKDIEQSMPDDDAWAEHVRQVRQKGSMVSEGLHKRKDGTTFPVEINVKIIKQGNNSYVVAVVRDITERKKAEQAIKESESKFKTIFENAGGAIFIADIESGILLDCNSEAERLTGLSRQEIIGIHQSKLHPVGESKKYRDKFAAHVEKEHSVDSEGQVQHKDGRRIPIWITAQTMRIAGNDVIVGLFIDITERKQAEQKQAQLLKEVEAVNQELKDFAYVVSHDLKAPLRGIRTLADWILSDYADKLDAEGKEQMDLMSSRVDRMYNLIDGILDYSRVGRVKEKRVQVNLNELVPEIIDMLAPPKNIAITVETQLPVVECEHTRIMQVFQNLLSNAVKYMDKPKGRIQVGYVEEDGFCKFSVADNGPGIEQKDFERIFKMFQTLKPRDEFESTGVGLTVVKKIVEMYGGHIWVESKTGEGSTFFFTLPKQEMGVKNAKFQTNTAC